MRSFISPNKELLYYMENNPTSSEQTLEDYRKMVKRAAHCVEQDCDNEALHLLETVCNKLCNPKNDEEADIYTDAIAVLMDLRRTDNEYVWEKTGPLLRDYLDWIDR